MSFDAKEIGEILVNDNSESQVIGDGSRSGEVNWNRTALVEKRLMNSEFYEEPDDESRSGYFGKRPIIGRDVPVIGGVYLGASSREAIVVSENSKLMTEFYQTIKDQLDEARDAGINIKSMVMKMVYDYVLEVMPYSQNEVDKIAKDYKLGRDEKISLEVYLNRKAGVCRHQALMVAYILESLKRDGYVRGDISVDRNSVKGLGGHAWVRYTNSRGVVYIIDPAQKYLGRLENVQGERWFYERPEDVVREQAA